MTIQRRCVSLCAALFLVAVLAGCNDEGREKGGGGEGGHQGIQGKQWVAGLCNLPSAGNCDASDSCASGSSCNITLANDGSGGVNLTLNGHPLTNAGQIVCVAQGASITWSVAASAGQHNSFLLDFGNVAPFSNNLTYGGGTDTQPASFTAAASNGCYKYNAKVCAIPATAGPTALSCGENDPKIIVGSGSTLTRQK
jgi:hypothetical protein